MNVRRASRWVAVALVGAAVAGVVAFTTGATATQAAWQDAAHTTATVTAGTWSTPATGDSCKAMGADGKQLTTGTCRITSVTYLQWTTGQNTVRDYYIGVELSANASYAQFSVDLSKGTGGVGSFSWTKARTVPTGQFTPVAGYTCATLPVVRANGPANWGVSYPVWVRVVQEPAGLGATANCS